ncbi:MAG: hypothetical protein WD795_15675 [Woeseia sp.]
MKDKHSQVDGDFSGRCGTSKDCLAVRKTPSWSGGRDGAFLFLDETQSFASGYETAVRQNL